MKQSAILRASYEAIYKNLSDLGKDNNFSVSNGAFDIPENEQETRIFLGVSDICQLSSDKNGEKIEVDETFFEAPVRIGCILSMTIISKMYPELLETTGCLIQYFKDNNVIVLGDFGWHGGGNEGKIFIEPVIRKPELQKERQILNFPAITLEYLMELAINSLKGTTFKRVDKKLIKGNIID